TLRVVVCGTALPSCTWAARPRGRLATGLAIDAGARNWGVQDNRTPLGEAAERATLHQQEVHRTIRNRFDLLSASNVSHWVFKERAELRKYFSSVRRSLVKDGIFMLDLYGGWEAHQAVCTKRAIGGGCKYVWDQGEVDPI